MSASATPLRFVLYPTLGEVREHVRAEIFGRALSQRLGRPVVVELAPSYEVLEEELAEGRVDMAWGTAEQCDQFAPQARAVLRAVRGGSCAYSAALVCRADAPLSLERLRGARAAWVAPRSTGGHLLPLRYLREQGLHPAELFSEQRFFGTYRKALLAVLEGEADVTSVYTNHPNEYSVRALLAGYVGAQECQLTLVAFTRPTLADGLILTRRMEESVAAAIISILTRTGGYGAGLEMFLGPFKVEGFVLVPAGQQGPVEPQPVPATEYFMAELGGEERCVRLWAPRGRAFGRCVVGGEGRQLREVLGAEASAPLEALARLVRHGGSISRMEYRLEVEGETRWYAAEATPTAACGEGSGQCVSVLVREVTELRALEEPLYRLASFPLLNPEPLLELGPEGELRYANPAAQATFPELLVLGAEHPLVEAALGWERRRAEQPECPTVHMDGRYWELAVARLVDPPGLRVFARDVTLRKQMEVRLVQADRLTALGSLAAAVGHEMNNPLAFMIANLCYIREELVLLRDALRERGDALGQGLEDVLAALGETEEGADRLKLIVQDLRMLSRKPLEYRTRVEVQPVLEQALQFIRSELRHRARLVKELQPVPAVEADESRLLQVFLNLLLNAVQAMGGEQASSNVLRVSTRVGPGGEAVVEVQDSGSGMPPEVLAHVFEPFFSTRPSSVGLGLAVSHAIVTSLGGTLRVESRVGAGTTVTATFPPAAGASQQAPSSMQ